MKLLPYRYVLKFADASFELQRLEEFQELDDCNVSFTNWIILRVLLIITGFGLSLGVQSIPFVVNAEYFPTSLRAQVNISQF